MAEKEYITLTLDKEQYEQLKQQARERSANEKTDLTVQDLVREAISKTILPSPMLDISVFSDLAQSWGIFDNVKVEQTPEGTLFSPTTSLVLPLITDKSKLVDFTSPEPELCTRYIVYSVKYKRFELMWWNDMTQEFNMEDGEDYTFEQVKVYGPLPKLGETGETK